MYTQGIIDISPNTNKERNLQQLGQLLETTCGLDSEWIEATLALSTPECTKIEEDMRIVAEKKSRNGRRKTGNGRRMSCSERNIRESQ